MHIVYIQVYNIQMIYIFMCPKLQDKPRISLQKGLLPQCTDGLAPCLRPISDHVTLDPIVYLHLVFCTCFQL
jgi:hypothetical protein